MAWRWQRTVLLAVVLIGILLPCAVIAGEDDEVTVTEEMVQEEDEVEEVIYATPKVIASAYLMETFDDVGAFENAWVKSQAKKDGVDEDIAKYDGVWAVESAERMALTGDRGLVLKSKAKHAAIAVALKRPFSFTSKPLVVQYEVNLQNGQECGGAYIKLLSSQDGRVDLKKFNDKTPYTIMFGPDKCGNDHKLHFIFRHINPLTGEVEEKHAKRPRDKIEEPFKDKKPHLYTLIVRPDNTYEINLDQEVINSGSLLEDFSPPVNPPKEIDDPEDFMPEEWDEREKIPDPDATKPDDWDEDAPMQIADPDAVKPSGWLDEEPEMIPDPTAEKPEDWDDEMDGEWEAALINNPKCADAPGCGEWKPPMIDNPNYKGKWRPAMIDNPNYRGKWKPRKISNPDFFEDLEPFKMTPIDAVGIELWSMSDNILFDNLIITDSIADANLLAAETFDLKVMKLEKGQVGVFRRILNYSNKHPWLYGIYVLLVAIPVVLIITCCCAEPKDSKVDKDAEHKKTDEPTADDPPADDPPADDAPADDPPGEVEGEAVEGEQEKVNNAASDEDAASGEEPADTVEGDADEEEDEEEEEEEQVNEEKGKEAEEAQTRTSPRLRKARRE
ncbi:calnexin-like [Homarus americanus]|uniref:calnexin-like n=1 Tax=Homarus americanus TaxID=6706 RepID=UPI001C491F08|nr:calnexin-like [Homarus americanus]XP_042207235.1 calnexin-like [Homarus americanus]